jgi:outer membrane receptor protein involved in Fe transport
LQQQDTAWFERQLIDTQLVGEFKLAPQLSLDVRGAYANSQREAPFELSYEYYRSNNPSDPFGAYFINRLNNGQQGDAEVSFSDLNENLWSAGADLGWKIAPDFNLTVGYAFADTARRTEKRDFKFLAPNTLPTGVALFRPDYLLQPSVINFYKIALIDINEGNPVFDAKLLNHAAYGQVQATLNSQLSFNIGTRYEWARQTVDPVQVFDTTSASLAGTHLERSYWLPALTLTYQVTPEMQLRASASKTIARPQFRELIFQTYYDPDSNRSYRGNPLLTDSQLYNAEARFEWYFARDQRLTAAGFYKKIRHPIETFASFSDNDVVSSFANAPR